MDYDKLIADAATKLNNLVNGIIDTLDKAGTPANPGTIISDITAKAFPEKDGVTQVDKPDWADSAFDTASDDDQSNYFSRAYSVLEANPDLEALYDKDPQMQLGEELWDIDNKNPNPRYNTLRDFISKHKFNVPVDRYSGKPDTEYLANVLALISNKDSKESTKNIIDGIQGVM
jgi:hypothetical protein